MTCAVFCPALVTLVAVHIINVCLCFSPEDIGDLFASMKDENTKSLNRKSHMHCIVECITRKECVFISSTFMPGDVIAPDRPYKCHLYLSNASETTPVEKTCLHQYQPIQMYPMAMAGACADHKCSTFNICVPLDEGYRCKPENRRGKNKRKTKKKSGG